MRGKGILIGNDFRLQLPLKWVPAWYYDPLSFPGHFGEKQVSWAVIGSTLYQNQALILSLRPGDLKDAPLVGAGIADALLSHDFLAWRRRVRQQMELDGQKVRSITFSSNQPLRIDAGYSNS